jgi:LPPG:FO 2-phospho-L-lactate transferase
MAGMRIVVLAGGIGGARFLLGVRALAHAAASAPPAAQSPPAVQAPPAALADAPTSTRDFQITAVVNIGDDVTLHGLRICPDLDSVMYTLGGGADPDRGWGRADETWTVRDELAAYAAEPSWFGLGDRDVATHLIRTRMLAAGYPLSAVTEALCARWRPGIRLLPASDDRVETHVVVPADDGETALHFQEWWVRHRGALPARRFVFVGADEARPADGVREALEAADVVLVAPSNPVVSIAPILAVPGIKGAIASGRARVVGVSPIIEGAPVRGMADRCLAAIDVPCTAAGVGRLYGARDRDGILDGWLVDTSDADTTVPGVAVGSAPLWMTDAKATEAMVHAALDLVGLDIEGRPDA